MRTKVITARKKMRKRRRDRETLPKCYHSLFALRNFIPIIDILCTFILTFALHHISRVYNFILVDNIASSIFFSFGTHPHFYVSLSPFQLSSVIAFSYCLLPVPFAVAFFPISQTDSLIVFLFFAWLWSTRNVSTHL